jgi:hypothetical protein
VLEMSDCIPDFELLPDGDELSSRPTPPNAGAGRPKGVPNRASEPIVRAAKERGEELTLKGLQRALNLQDEIDFKCWVFFMSRLYPKPRSAPIAVSIAQLGSAALVEAVQSGELTASDAAALVRARQQAVDLLPAGNGKAANGQDARQVLADRLERIVAARPTPEPTLPPELTEEQIVAMVETALKKKLEERNA